MKIGAKDVSGADMTQNQAIGSYGHHHRDEPGAMAQAGIAFMRLIFPVLAYVVALGAAWTWQSVPATWADGWTPGLTPSAWLTHGHVLLALAFFLNNLVSRRYGFDLAVWHALASWIVLGLAVLAALMRLHPQLPMVALPPMAEAAAFASGLILAHVVGAFVFDRTRGVRWWAAPLWASLIGGLVFVVIYYAIAQPGGADWTQRAGVAAIVMVVMSVALLIPYFVLRPVIRPLPGFGGF
jgi:hypothetical protein